jgi:hypothetical protein
MKMKIKLTNIINIYFNIKIFYFLEYKNTYFHVK